MKKFDSDLGFFPNAKQHEMELFVEYQWFLMDCCVNRINLGNFPINEEPLHVENKKE